MYWGGLRGALAPALALGLPAAFGDLRGQIQAMVFGLVLFNLLVQGITMGPLVRSLKLVQRTATQDEYERRHARAVASRAAHAHLEQRFHEGLLSHQTWENLTALFQRRTEALTEAVGDVIRTDPSVETEELDTAWREALRAQRSTFTQLLRDGVITEDTFSSLVGEVDLALTETDTNWATFARGSHLPSINSLMTVFVQEPDAENAANALNKLGFSITRLPSTGGLLGKRIVTLLIGIPNNQKQIAIKTLETTCNQRVDYAHRLPGTPSIGLAGATIFTFDIERYVEL